MKIQKLKLADLAPNTGQVPGLPINPRQWTKSDVDAIAKSLRETPELFEARPLLVIPHDGKYVILGGNLRYEGARQNKDTEVPAIVFPEDTPIDKMKEIVVKDNGSFGAWDYDALANEWDDLPLGDWGVPAWNNDLEDTDSGLTGDDDNNYSRKIEVPTYEPSSTNPSLSECFDTKKRNELVQEIEATDIPVEVKEFLVAAAGRHIVFHYDKIADYYAHAKKEVQQLMEHSALVIIDMGGAIDNGFVKLAKKIAAQYEKDYGGAE